ncbi:chemotaxis protein CheB [Actinoplanes sp. Pm04-4]|uniref:protein-glutamate methylesterase n=1 Tax=Paractinoplanes pyxinae TaxID=2997416 RepID=A0ABT4BC75_9ACTN|nr:chemotaxis protein CheB [Actinoplanes pyxinae]MCY1144129.1 chemotaxis protein CheB [Actinoplanes pyxinae]
MHEHGVVVIGASAGGIHALHEVLGGLPAGLSASVLVVVHTPPTSPRLLPDVLARCGPLPAAYAVPGQRLTAGLVTIAPPGQHLVLTAGDVLRLHCGPLVHRARPAVDPLLHSVAGVCRNRAIAVVLSGRLRDGADGAAAVAANGGTVLVQDPVDAANRGMPLAALELPDAAVWPAAKLGPVIADLIDAAVPAARDGHDTAGGSGPRGSAEIDEALWVAVSRLQTHADGQRRLLQRLQPGTLIAAQCQARAERALHAAQVITDRVLPIIRGEAEE